MQTSRCLVLIALIPNFAAGLVACATQTPRAESLSERRPSAAPTRSVGRQPVRIMCLGDSNTYGFSPTGDPSVNDGYRKPLAQILNAKAVPFQFVGAMEDTRDMSFDQRWHSGFSGWAADDLLRGEGALQPMDAVLQLQPNVILLMAGTNDFFVKHDTPKQAEDNLLQLVLRLEALAPQARIFVATIFPIVDVQAHPPVYQKLNAQVQSLNEWILSDLVSRAGPQVGVVDQYVAFRIQNSVDGLHANADGYSTAATVWSRALLNYFHP